MGKDGLQPKESYKEQKSKKEVGDTRKEQKIQDTEKVSWVRLWDVEAGRTLAGVSSRAFPLGHTVCFMKQRLWDTL